MVNVKRLRCFIGWLAILLPIIVMVLSLIYGHGFPKSISATYFFDECITPFMIVLGGASCFLLYYDGYDKLDDILNTITGLFGLCICFFPCAAGGTFRLTGEINSTIHNVSAVLFFVMLAYISFFQFTKTSGNMTAQKKTRNIIYRVCGVGMLASFLILLIPGFAIKTWLTEAFALCFFGVSWLTKANAYKWLSADPISD